MLRHFLAATAHHMLPPDTLINLYKAVDTGNIQFVRLLLQHIVIDEESIKFARYAGFRTSRAAVNVDMLAVLHKEFNCLFRIPVLWLAALKYAVKCSMLDCVQYILDNMPVHVLPEMTNALISKCLRRCAKKGNSNMFQYLAIKSQFNLKSNDITGIITEACDHGQESFLRYLNQHVDNEVSRDFIRHCLELRTPLAAIRTNDLASMSDGSFNDQSVELDAKTCNQMSKEMATLICGPPSTAHPLVYTGQSLINMIRAVVKPGTNITEDLVCQFIVNLRYKLTLSISGTLDYAAGFSAKIMTLINQRFKSNSQHLKYRCIKESAIKFVSVGALEDIIFMLGHLDHVKRDPEICLKAVLNEDPRVFEHLIALFTIDKINSNESDMLDQIVELAHIRDKPHYVKTLQQHFGLDPSMPLFIPSLNVLHSMVESNAYHSLEYHFNTSTFSQMPIEHRLRTIHSIMDKGYHFGATHVIKLCTDQITAITINHIQSLNYDQDKPKTHQCSHELETAVHSVLGDRKLGMLIMEHVGLVHKSLGYESDQVIKGSQLIDNHSLADYINYGATEWFIKANASVEHCQNTSLLELAFSKCNKIVIDVLLDNTRMCLEPRPMVTEQFVKEISSCSHPQWEWMFDQYTMITSQGAPLKISQQTLQLVQHPSFLRKLIQCGAKLTNYYFKDMDAVREWVSRPWASDMFQLLAQHKLVGTDEQHQILVQAIEQDKTSIVRYYLNTNMLQTLMSDDTRAQEIVDYCCIHGRMECLDMILPLLPIASFSCVLDDPMPGGQGVRLEWSFKHAAKNGHLDIMQRLQTFELNRCDQAFQISAMCSLQGALANGHMEVFEYILNVIALFTNSNSDSSEHMVPLTIQDIHHSILSINLIKRLMALPFLKCELSNVLIEAIKWRNKEVIDMCIDYKYRHVNPDYYRALDTAVEVCDLDTLRRIIVAMPIVKPSTGNICSMINQLGRQDNKVTEEVIIELLDQKKLSPWEVTSILQSSARKTPPFFMMMVNHLNITSIPGILLNDWKPVIEIIIKRGDTESLDYLINQELIPVRHLPELINLEHCNASVLEHLFDKRYITMLHTITAPSIPSINDQHPRGIK
ncbi:hypothetical protein SAMD00019534_100710 [Acytostelium subglobosum LB1]|uniref:hypothetical protein n=1 Tax=Acytostelium subglobosum LB1 TaxID=1410327 RepID=UPI000644A50C|nr:hypothetical protein SAMD00019534_100710 [Acytostelium subglobosum LB1]GAM26896.1 hypothetical protein SAMD00019534_100710 [Acytostelium subglobosum LB1]|eukprot:XP_012750164.1 hypothetical protein SAMD00019534_100710 [Acytostelium subglobosum LB1]